MKLSPRFILIGFLLFSLGASAGTIFGPTSLSPGTTSPYAYNGGETIVFPTWTVSGGGKVISTSQSGTSYTAQVKGVLAGSFVLSFYDGSTLKASLTVTVTGTVLPQVTDGGKCGTGSMLLNANGGAYTIRWYSAISGGTHFTTGTSWTTPILSTTTYYYLSVYDAVNAVESSRVKITAGIYSAPAVPATATNVTAFSNATTTLTVSAVSGMTYRWYDQALGGTLITTTATPSYTMVMPSSTKDYYVAAVAGGACESVTRIKVTANLEANPTVGAPIDKIVMGTYVTLDAGAGYATYTWKNSANVTVASTQTYKTNIADDYTVTVTKTGVSGSGKSGVFKVKGQLGDIDKNYIISNILLTPVTIEDSINRQKVNARSQSIQYFDGLGRATQSISTQGSPTFKDIVQPIVYDEYGREAIKYLPYTSTESNGWYKNNPLGAVPPSDPHALLMADYNSSAQASFYNNVTDNIADDVNPFSVSKFEASPLNRVLKQGAPGAAWQPDASPYTAPTDHSVKMAYKFNTANEVLKWTWAASASSPLFGLVNASTGPTPVYYDANQLYKTLSKDEQNNEVIEYKDKDGRVILKKVKANATTYAETYYIYDDFGNLITVLQPEGTKNLSTQYFNLTDNTKDTYLNKWAFRYAYDALLRMTMKKVPGAEPVFVVYDERGRVVLTQDGNQRKDINNVDLKKWSFIKYDAFNRPVLTGEYAAATVLSQSAMQLAVNTFYAGTLPSTKAWYESYISTDAGNILGYDNKSFPTINTINDCYTATYYDKYDTYIAPTTPVNYSYVVESPALPLQEATKATNIKGQMTATLVKIMGTTTFLRTVNYYDAKHRVIQSISDHHKGTQGIQRLTNVYDFPGRVTTTRRTYVVNSVTNYVKETFTYDHASRVLTVKHSTNGAPDVITAKNTYNELGQLVDKNLHSTDNGTTFKQSVDYRYNIRGWMNKINEADVSAVASGDVVNDYFGMELGYNGALTGTTATAQFNGNISAVQWSTGGGTATKKQSYAYGYDMLNRLLTSSHNTFKASAWNAENGAYSENISSYDLNGNINGLVRKGSNGVLMDQLLYNYTGNKLDYVNDAAGAAATTGFINGNTGTDDYTYDNNGNLKTDKNKGITAITYNYMNLPQQVNKGATDYIVYTYDATGKKLTQQVYGTTPKTTDYVGELVYEGAVLKFIQQSEGRILPDGAAWEYQYNLKDHLGNVRVTFTAKTQVATNYTTDFEAATSSTFNNYTNTTYDLIDHTDAAGTTYQKAQLLNGGVNARTGLAKSIPVMPGDQVTASAYVKYMNLGTTSNTNAFITSLASAFGVSSGSTGDNQKIYTSLNSYATGVPLGDHVNDDEGAPKAFVTILFFDKDYNFLDAAWDQVSTVGAQTSATVKQPPHDLVSVTAKAKEAGYAYVFLSNEHPYFVDVYFDDFTLSHTPSPIVSVSDYFAFGLTFNSYSRESSLKNKYLYNAGSELQDDLDLGVYETYYRMLDPANGRWWQVDPLVDNMYDWSPYNYSFNNPIRYNDPKGDCPPGVDCGALASALGSHISENPDGAVAAVSGFVLGLGNAAGNSISGLVNAVTNPVETLNGLASLGSVEGQVTAGVNMAVAGAQKIDQFQNGTALDKGIVVGEVTGAVVEAVAGTKAGALLKTAEASTVAKTLKVTTSTGSEVTSFTKHAVNRAIERGVKPPAILNALKKPLKVGEVVTDKAGRQSQRFVGSKAEVVVNPQSKKVVSVNPTSTKKAAKLAGQ